ncbi:MAG: hypothetical protein J5608_03185 [Alphaproteobacteria bacterium]|nr:hypothetical protein [Alphaproteobacteria bacterium]
MKKTCVFALAMILAMPAFAATKTAKADKTATAPLTEEVTLPADNASAKVADEKAVADKTAEKTVAETEPLKLETKTKTETNPKIKFPHGMQLGVGISATSGLDGFIGYNNKKFDSFWWKRFGVRFDFATTGPVKSFINKNIDRYIGDEGIEINDEISIVDASIKSKHMAALIDIYPFGDTWFLGGWRLTGGYVLGKMDVDADLKGSVEGLPAGTIEFEFSGTKYRYLGNDVYGTATLDWNFNGPYLGTGFDLGLFYGFKLFLDAGVVFTNKAAELDLKVDVNNLQYDNGGGWTNFAGDPNYNNLVADFNARKKAELQDAQDELDKYKFFPIVKMGFMYRF